MVTGGAGFIGSHLVEELLSLGVKVISVDDYSAGKKTNLASFQDNPSLEEVNCDVSDLSALRKCFDDVDIVFHNAASKKKYMP